MNYEGNYLRTGRRPVEEYRGTKHVMGVNVNQFSICMYENVTMKPWFYIIDMCP